LPDGDVVLDLLFAVIFVGAPVASIIILRSAALTAVLTAALIGVSGVLMQWTALTFTAFTYRQLQLWLAVTLLALLAASFLLRATKGPRLDRVTTLLIAGSSVAVGLAFLASRALAPGSPGALSGVGYLIQRTDAEDNAKWLNAAAQLASGSPVDPRASVGGPLVLVLVVAATLVSLASFILYGGVNQVAVSADTLILSETMLIILAPFALAPLVQMKRKWDAGGARSRLPWPFALLGLVILASGVAVLLNFGHLTLQFTILVLALWVSTFIAGYRTAHARVLTTVAVICCAEVWFPLNVFALVLLLGLIGYGAYGLYRRTNVNFHVAVLAGGLVLFVLMFDFLRSSIMYALGLDGQQAGSVPVAAGSGAVHGVSTVSVPTLPLFSSPGGTEEVTTIIGAITVLAVIGAAIVLGRGRRDWRAALPFAPIIGLVAYAVLITLADFWAIGSGPNYASKKLAFAVVLPILAATVPIALLLLDRTQRGMTLMRWLGLGGVAALLVLDTLLPRAMVQIKPALWPTATGDPAPYWWPAEVKATGDQPLSSNPIGCVYLPQGAERPSVLQDGPRAYSCTRILTGLSGQDVAAAGLVQWELDEWLQNESNWDHFHSYLSQMSADVRSKPIIILDNDSKVIGIEPLQTLLERYPPKPETESAQ